MSETTYHGGLHEIHAEPVHADPDALFTHIDAPYGDGKVLAAINALEDPMREVTAMLQKLGPVIRGKYTGDPVGSLFQFGDFVMPNVMVSPSSCKGELFAVATWEPANIIYTRPKIFSSRVFEETVGAWGPTLSAMDPPEHGKYRKVMQQSLTADHVKRYELEIARPIIERRFRELKEGKTSADFARELTSTYVYEIVGKMVGFPSDAIEFVATCFHHMFNIPLDPAAGARAIKDLQAYAARLIEARRAVPTDDMISKFVGAEIDGQPIDEEYLNGFVITLLAGAIDTVYSQSGILLLLLIDHPDQQELLRRDRSLIPRFIDEGTRYQGTTGWGARQVTEDTELLGTKIPRGSVVVTILGAINRDPDRWPDPHKLDVMREPKPHVGFSAGIHFCAGAHVARMILGILIEHIIDDLPNVKWDPSQPKPKVTGWMQRRPLALPIIWDAS